MSCTKYKLNTDKIIAKQLEIIHKHLGYRKAQVSSGSPALGRSGDFI